MINIGDTKVEVTNPTEQFGGRGFKLSPAFTSLVHHVKKKESINGMDYYRVRQGINELPKIRFHMEIAQSNIPYLASKTYYTSMQRKQGNSVITDRSTKSILKIDNNQCYALAVDDINYVE